MSEKKPAKENANGKAEEEKEKEAGLDSHRDMSRLQPPERIGPRKEDMEAAAAIVLGDEGGKQQSSRKRHVTFLLDDQVQTDGGSPAEERTAGEESEGETAHETRPTPQPRPPVRESRPGAYAVPGIDGEQDDDDDYTFTASTVNQNETVAVSAQLFGDQELDQIVNQRVQHALREERDHAPVAQVLPELEPDQLPNNEDEEAGQGVFFCLPKRWRSRRCRVLGAIGAAITLVCVVVVTVLLTGEDAASQAATPTMAPTGATRLTAFADANYTRTVVSTYFFTEANNDCKPDVSLRPDFTTHRGAYVFRGTIRSNHLQPKIPSRN